MIGLSSTEPLTVCPGISMHCRGFEDTEELVDAIYLES